MKGDEDTGVVGGFMCEYKYLSYVLCMMSYIIKYNKSLIIYLYVYMYMSCINTQDSGTHNK